MNAKEGLTFTEKVSDWRDFSDLRREVALGNCCCFVDRVPHTNDLLLINQHNALAKLRQKRRLMLMRSAKIRPGVGWHLPRWMPQSYTSHHALLDPSSTGVVGQLFIFFDDLQIDIFQRAGDRSQGDDFHADRGGPAQHRRVELSRVRGTVLQPVLP